MGAQGGEKAAHTVCRLANDENVKQAHRALPDAKSEACKQVSIDANNKSRIESFI